jgi:hypothetical protein
MTTPLEHANAAIELLAEKCTEMGLQLRGAIALTVSFAVNEERERCARVVKEAMQGKGAAWESMADDLAALIRQPR